jgi:hypothetical protein
MKKSIVALSKVLSLHFPGGLKRAFLKLSAFVDHFMAVGAHADHRRKIPKVHASE